MFPRKKYGTFPTSTIRNFHGMVQIYNLILYRKIKNMGNFSTTIRSSTRYNPERATRSQTTNTNLRSKFCRDGELQPRNYTRPRSKPPIRNTITTTPKIKKNTILRSFTLLNYTLKTSSSWNNDMKRKIILHITRAIPYA